MCRAVSTLHPKAAEVANALLQRGFGGPFREFDVTTKTAAEAADALGCEVGAIANTLVFVADEEPVVVFSSGAHRVDTDRLARAAGALSARKATADEVKMSTGQSIGGVSPVNWPQPLRVFIDGSLGRYRQIWAACGTPNAVFATSYDELARLTSAQSLAAVTD